MSRRLRFRTLVTAALGTALIVGGAALVSPSASAAQASSMALGPAATPPVTPPPTTKPPVSKPPVTKPPVKRCKPPVIPPLAKPYPKFFRQTTKPGMRDGGPFAINHVREAQYRLRWAHYYKGKVAGYYSTAVKTAVKRFQTNHCMRATGTLDRATWAVLIQKTLRHTVAIPKVCRSKGWHSCYDRSIHQDLLFRNGTLWNAWLVRGGQYSTKTRTGNYRVFARYTKTISTLYHVPMWYFMPHSGGQGQHGSGFMVDPFVGHSHGCINLYIKDARVLFYTTKNQRLNVTVYGRWS